MSRCMENINGGVHNLFGKLITCGKKSLIKKTLSTIPIVCLSFSSLFKFFLFFLSYLLVYADFFQMLLDQFFSFET